MLRGISDQTIDKPTATARWANTDEIADYRSIGQETAGAILLGYTMEAHDPDLLKRLDDLSSTFSRHPIAQREPDMASQNLRSLQYHRENILTEYRPLWFADNRHLITIAGSRSGKGTSAIIPNLCLYPGSCIVIDPKGENATITASRRGAGSESCDGLKQQVIVLDPFRVAKVADDLRGQFNPFSLLTIGDEDIVDKASSIADALVVRSNDRDAHWDESARELIKALILYVSALDSPEIRNLPMVLKLLREGWASELDDIDPADIVPNPATGKPDPLRTLFADMAKVDLWDGAISGVAASMLSMGENEFGSVLSNARRNLGFLEKPGMRRVLEKTSFQLDELKTAEKGLTIYLVLPPSRMVDCDRWLRLMIAISLERIYSVRMPASASGEPAPDDATGTGHPILFLLEEFPVLGHMKIIETAAGFAAGYGVRLWLIAQDLTQLKRHYREGWETFIGNAGVLQAFGNSDVTTLEYLSKKLGETETLQHTVSTTASAAWSSNNPSDYSRASAWLAFGGMKSLLIPFIATANQQTTGVTNTTTTATNPQLQRSPLLKPDEIERLFRREDMAQLVHIKGQRPFFLHRQNYFANPDFLGKFDPDRPDPKTGKRLDKKAAAADADAIKQRRNDDRQTAADAAVRFADAIEAMIRKHTPTA